MTTGIVILLAAAASAQDNVDAHGFRLVPSDGQLLDTLSTWRAERYEPVSGGVDALFEYAYRPLTLHERVDGVESTEVLVDDLAALNLGGFLALDKRVAVTASVPIFLTADELGLRTGPGLGDLRLAVPVGVVLPDREMGFGVSLVPHVDLPTAVGNHVYLSNEGVAGGFTLVGSVTNENRWDVSANLGVEITPGAELFNMNGRERLVARLAGAYILTDGLALRGEVLSRPSLRDNAFNGTESPMEAQVSLKGETGIVTWTLGAAKALNQGVSAAVWRGFAGVGIAFGKKKVVGEECTECAVVEPPAPCPPCQEVVCLNSGEFILMKPIRFDFDKDTIRMEDSHEVLMGMVKALKDHPEVLKVQVATGTDVRGSDAYNMDLSARRAKSVVNFLVSEGVDPSRLTSVGFGETRLLEPNCATEECHERNRYSLFTVLDVASAEQATGDAVAAE